MSDAPEDRKRDWSKLPITVASPSHYTYGKAEAIDYMRDMGILEDYCVGNVMKYLHRFRHKGSAREDIEKAIRYLQILREEL